MVSVNEQYICYMLYFFSINLSDGEIEVICALFADKELVYSPLKWQLTEYRLVVCDEA